LKPPRRRSSAALFFIFSLLAMVFSAFSSIAIASVSISILGSDDEKLLRAFLRAFVVSNFLLQLLPSLEELLVAQAPEVCRWFFFSVVFLPSLVVFSSLSASRSSRRRRRRRGRSGRRRRSALRRGGGRRGRGRFISPPLCHFDVLLGVGGFLKLYVLKISF